MKKQPVRTSAPKAPAPKASLSKSQLAAVQGAGGVIVNVNALYPH